MRARQWALGGAVLLVAGCVTHRGAWRMEPADQAKADAQADATADARAASRDDGVELVLLANLSPEDRGARAVATRVEQVLRGDRPRVVLWLGNVAAAPMGSATMRAQRRGPRCAELSEAWASPAASALANALRGPDAAPSFAVPGVLDHRCGHGPALRRSERSGPHPWRMPGSHYVLRVLADGSVSERAVCRESGCTFAKAPSAGPSPSPSPAQPARPLVDLVVIDLAPWLHPASEPAERRRDEQRVQALEILLSAIAAVPPEGAPPRLLVSSVPVEAAGEHGLGALWPEATFHNLPATLQSMLVQGHFAGVLAGHDRSLYATPDLTDAIKRADRAWLRAPVFQVVAGAVSRPNERAAMALRPLRIRRSQAYVPPVWSDHAGFAVVHLQAEHAELELHAHRGRHWERASMTVPLRPPPHPGRTPSPHMAPCRDCPPIPASER